MGAVFPLQDFQEGNEQREFETIGLIEDSVLLGGGITFKGLEEAEERNAAKGYVAGKAFQGVLWYTTKARV